MFVDRAKSLTAVLASIVVLAGCALGRGDSNEPLIGAWRSQVQFTSGPFATVRDLEFMYIVHADGTLTESSTMMRHRRYLRRMAFGVKRRPGIFRRTTSSI